MALGSKEVLPGGDPFQPPPRRPAVVRLVVTPVCWLLAAASLALFVLGLDDRPLVEASVMHGPALARGEWWRLATWVVTHGGPLHLFFNLSALWTLGRMLEVGIGTWRFLLGTLAGVLGSAVLVLLVNYDAKTVGLSGVILAWLGFALPVANLAARRQLGLWLIQIAVLSLIPGVSWAGHLGGLLAGLPAGFALRQGRGTFAVVMPVLLFVLAVGVVVAAQGRWRW